MYYFPKKLGGPNALLAPPFHSLGGPWPPWPPPWRTPWHEVITTFKRVQNIRSFPTRKYSTSKLVTLFEFIS